MRLKVVLDTNVLIDAIPEWSRHRIVLDALLDDRYDAVVNNEIFKEYEEKITERFDAEVAERTLDMFKILPNVFEQEVWFHFNLIVNDPDDNKFTDCALAANAHYIVTNDRDFNVLKSLPFPKIGLLKTEEFASMLISGEIP